jgi:hypothetical protein
LVIVGSAEHVELDALAAEYENYRVLSMRAVAAIVLGILALPALYFEAMLPIALVGVLVGLLAIRAIKASKSELTGMLLAQLGTCLAAVALVAGTARWTYVYQHEVPEGPARISFVQLQPDPKHPELFVSPMSLDLDGQKVFIKGYVYPGDKRKDLRQFILVPDKGTCCFGGNPKLTDMIEVTLEEPLRVNYSFRKRGLAGTLRVDKTPKPVNGLGGVCYRLEADYVK